MRRLIRAIRGKSPASPKLSKVLSLYGRLAQIDPATLQRNRRVFQQFIRQTGDIRADRVTRMMATEFCASLSASGKARATIVSYCASVSSIFGWSVENIDGVAANPFAGLRKPKVNRRPVTYWTRDELLRLHEAIDRLEWREPVRKLQWHGIVQIADDCGLRIGEILNLRWCDVDFDGESPTLTVRYRPHTPGVFWEWGTKGKRDRVIGVPFATLVVLQRLRVACPWVYFLLPRARCQSLQQRSVELSDATRKRPYNNLYMFWNRIKKTAAVEGDGAFHRIRRTAATELGEHLTVPQLQQMFGWQDYSTPQRYVGLREKAHRAAVAQAQAARHNHQVS